MEMIRLARPPAKGGGVKPFFADMKRNQLAVFFWVLAAGLWLGTFRCAAALDMFLEFPNSDIEGESTAAGHEKQIDVLSWSWGASNSGTTQSGGGGGAGKVSFQDLSITKYVDKASPKLLLRTCNGAHLSDVTLWVLRSGPDAPVSYLKIMLKEVMVTSVSHGGSGGEDRLTETITLNFAKIQFEYYPQKKDGSADAPVSASWNIIENTPTF
jgi:type VI secretion system secreted protein Hcp